MAPILRVSLAALLSSVFSGCFSRVAYPDNSACTNYKPLCGDQTCSVDSHGCESCTCNSAPSRETYSPDHH